MEQRILAAAGVRAHIATEVALEVPDLHDIRGAVRADLGVGAQLTPVDVLGPVLETLQDLRREGKTQAIGCCAWGGEYDAAREVLNSGAFDTVLVGYSLLNPTSGRSAPAGFRHRDFGNIMQVAADNGTSSVVLRVLESGTLAGLAQPHPTSGSGRDPFCAGRSSRWSGSGRLFGDGPGRRGGRRRQRRTALRVGSGASGGSLRKRLLA